MEVFRWDVICWTRYDAGCSILEFLKPITTSISELIPYKRTVEEVRFDKNLVGVPCCIHEGNRACYQDISTVHCLFKRIQRDLLLEWPFNKSRRRLIKVFFHEGLQRMHDLDYQQMIVVSSSYNIAFGPTYLATGKFLWWKPCGHRYRIKFNAQKC